MSSFDLEQLMLATSSAQTEAQAQAHLAARRKALYGETITAPTTADEHDYGAPEPVLPPLAPPPRPLKAKPTAPASRPRLAIVPKSS